MVKVGITGGIGSGKTTVCKTWERLGAKVVYADDLAKELMTKDQLLKDQIIQAFGKKAYTSDGTLNRTYLAEEAFEKNRVEDLNRLVHPRVRKRIRELIAEAERNDVPMFAQEAALLLNKGRPDFLDYIVLVVADKEKRIQWVRERDSVSREEVLGRMSKQQDVDQLKSMSDYVIENNSTTGELEKKAVKLFRKLTKTSEKLN